MKGKLIVIEGLDGAGKGAVIGGLGETPGLVARLQTAGKEVLVLRAPGGTRIGEHIRALLKDPTFSEMDARTEALLFAASRAQLAHEVIRPALAEGKLVISDRYSDSRYAYQAVTLTGVIPDPEKWLRAMHNGWSIVPDKTFLCILPVDEALARLKPQSAREHFENRDVLEKVQQNYLSFARAEPSRFVIIDAMKEKDEIAVFVADSIRQILQLSRSRRRR